MEKQAEGRWGEGQGRWVGRYDIREKGEKYRDKIKTRKKCKKKGRRSERNAKRKRKGRGQVGRGARR